MSDFFFTICSKNFLAQALTLYQSLREAHGQVRFYAALCDGDEGWDPLSLPFPVIHVEELGIPGWESMRHQYSITELNTSLKPFAFQYLFDRHPGASVLYLDPDILVLTPLSEALDALAGGAACVLTPHILEPAEFAEFDDQKFLQFGAYNLGFCGLRDTPQVQRVVSWWGRRLEEDCLIDLSRGLFVDQKWVDLFPAFIDRTVVLRHPGYNVAYWNLSQRRVWRGGGKWMANDQEVRFVHFSGLAIGDQLVFTRHSQSVTRKNIGELALLTRRYEDQLKANGRSFFSTLPYAFSWEGATGRNLHAPLDKRPAVRPDVPPWLPLQRETSLAVHLANVAHCAGQEKARREVELGLLPVGEKAFAIEGHCALCGAKSEFLIGFDHAPQAQGVRVPNWREHLACSRCKLSNRLRAALQIFRQELQPNPQAAIYVTERVTRTFSWLRERFPNLEGSEYFADARRPGELVDGIRHEDLQALSFGDASFDCVLSFDVLEHVPFETRAFAEMFRILKPGGKLLFTAPFSPGSEKNVVRAVLEPHGEIRHLMEPEYHGNPVDPEGGALAFRYYGWEVLDQLKDAGFRNPAALHYWSRELGYLGECQYVFVAEKPL